MWPFLKLYNHKHMLLFLFLKTWFIMKMYLTHQGFFPIAPSVFCKYKIIKSRDYDLFLDPWNLSWCLYIIYLLGGWKSPEDISWSSFWKYCKIKNSISIFEIEIVELLIFLIFSLKKTLGNPTCYKILQYFLFLKNNWKPRKPCTCLFQ